jgi:hypothetical protein
MCPGEREEKKKKEKKEEGKKKDGGVIPQATIRKTKFRALTPET